MMSFQAGRLSKLALPQGTVWLATNIAEAKGRQDLYTKQAPQLLRALRETALVQSTESSNRIEGVTVAPDRLRPLVIGNARPRDRSEEDIHGYRQALNLIHAGARDLAVLCIHPFRDGNGRVARLLTLLGLYHHGYEVGRYVSLERLVEESKEDYYEGLRRSSDGWHEGHHDLLPWLNYFLAVVRRGYREFEERAGQVKTPRGAKTALVAAAVDGFPGDFTLAQLERACPGVSRDMVRRVLKDFQKAGKIVCLGRGPGAAWRRKGNTSLGR